MSYEEGSYEEVRRRALVAAVKEAGTLIRKEELKRQALSARINKPIVENLLQNIESKLTTMPDLGKEITESTAKAYEEGKPVLEAAINTFIESLLKSFPLLITGGIDELKTLINEANQQIRIANHIIGEINKAGIFVPSLEDVSYRSDDYMSLYSALKVAKERLKTVKDFYGELEKVAAE